MWHPDDIKKFDFGESANYRIVVQGCLEESFSERLGGMRITTSSRGEKALVTILEGRLMDQAELSGVLNSLYEMHLPILSVEALPDDASSP
jgi:hypothetical protein